jgi:type IV secretory pathway TrbD component
MSRETPWRVGATENREESFSLLHDYMGIDRRTLLIFTALVVGVTVVVTGIYVAIFGFDTWTTNMERAGSMMVANFDPRVNGQGQDIPDIPDPRVRAPAMAPANLDVPPWGVNTRPVAAPPAAQFVCPKCGAVGLPAWSQAGAPLCPYCRGVMSVAGRAFGIR